MRRDWRFWAILVAIVLVVPLAHSVYQLVVACVLSTVAWMLALRWLRRRHGQ